MCEATRWMLGASIHRAERSAFWRDARPTSRFSGAGLLAAKRRRGRCRAECGQALAAVHTSGEAGIAGWGFLFLVSGSFNVDKAFHNRAVFRLWKGVLACSCSRVSDWLVGLVWRAVDLEEPRCCGPFARLLESRAKGLRARAYWPRRTSAQSGRRGYPSFSLWRLGVLGFWSKKARLPTIRSPQRARRFFPQRRSRRYGINP